MVKSSPVVSASKKHLRDGSLPDDVIRTLGPSNTDNTISLIDQQHLVFDGPLPDEVIRTLVPSNSEKNPHR